MERIQKHQFLVSKDDQLMGCIINKVASTSMMQAYLMLSGIEHVEKISNPHPLRSKFVPKVKLEKFFSQMLYSYHS